MQSSRNRLSYPKGTGLSRIKEQITLELRTQSKLTIKPDNNLEQTLTTIQAIKGIKHNMKRSERRKKIVSFLSLG